MKVEKRAGWSTTDKREEKSEYRGSEVGERPEREVIEVYRRRGRPNFGSQSKNARFICS